MMIEVRFPFFFLLFFPSFGSGGGGVLFGRKKEGEKSGGKGREGRKKCWDGGRGSADERMDGWMER